MSRTQHGRRSQRHALDTECSRPQAQAATGGEEGWERPRLVHSDAASPLALFRHQQWPLASRR